MSASAVILSDDLLFASRITAVAAGLGLTVTQARSLDALADIARQQPPACVLVDLAQPGLAVPELICRLQAVSATMPLVVAYGSHVDAAGLRAARAAGCDLVLPRSKFVEELPRLLPEWVAGRPGE